MLWFESDGIGNGTGGKRLLFSVERAYSTVKKLRAKGLDARRGMSVEARTTASKIICERVIASREFYSCRTIACYLPMPDEVDTLEIIERAWCANKRVFVPILRKRRNMSFCRLTPDTTLVRSDFGIWEPVDSEEISPRRLDLVVTPTVAFDENRHRIGMGGGYYDRCFAFLRNRQQWLRPKLAGIAFASQKVEKITPNPWDIRLYRIFTDA